MYCRTWLRRYHMFRRCFLPNGASPTPESLVVEDFNPAELHVGEGEVLIRTSFAAVNPLSSSYSSFSYQDGNVLSHATTDIVASAMRKRMTGEDGSGAVVKCGKGVPTSRLGERVVFLRPSVASSPVCSGAFASFTVASASETFFVPAPISDSQAAALFRDALMASYVVHGILQDNIEMPRATFTVPDTMFVVTGAATGQGLVMSQMLQEVGAPHVVGLCASQEMATLATKFGAYHQVLDRTSEGFAGQLEHLYPNSKIRAVVVVDTRGDNAEVECLESLVSSLSDRCLLISLTPMQQQRVVGMSRESKFISLNDVIRREQPRIAEHIQRVWAGALRGSLRSHVTRTFNLGECGKAHVFSQSSGMVGKILVNCQE